MHHLHLPTFCPDFIISSRTPNQHECTSLLEWQTTVTGGDLDGGGLDAAEGGGLAVRQLVHGGLGDVEPGGGVVDGQDVDGAPAVAQLPASAAAGRVPARDGGGAADVGEAGDGALGLVAVAGDEAVDAVGARDGGHGAACVVVAGVVGDCGVMLVISEGYKLGLRFGHTSDGGGSSGQGEDAEDVGEHFEGWV